MTELQPLIARPVKTLGDNAPIAEALIDIQVAFEKPVPLDALRSFNKEIEAAYPKVRTQQEWAGQIRLEAENSTVTSKHGIRGYLFLSDDEKQIVQVRRDGFTFSRRWPYDSFDAVRREAEPLWRRYLEVTSPTKVTRLAVRYVNHIGFEQENVVLHEWLRLHPVAPPEFSTMAEYVVRLVLPHPKSPRYVANVTQATIPPFREGHKNAVLLDIDVWTATDLDPTDHDKLWKVMKDLRTYKNDIFYGTITTKTREWLDGGTAGPV